MHGNKNIAEEKIAVIVRVCCPELINKSTAKKKRYAVTQNDFMQEGSADCIPVSDATVRAAELHQGWVDDMRRDGTRLQYAPAEVASDREVVLEAIRDGRTSRR